MHRQADVRDREQVLALIDGVVAEHGRLDVLVNGAIGELHLRPFDELDWAAFQHHLATQVHGVFNTCQVARPHLAARGGGVVNILSQVVHGTPPPQMADYVAAKYALLGLSRALASEWASGGIRVNTVSPGLTRTELTQHYNEPVFKMDASRTPLRRLASPEEYGDYYN